VRLDTMTCSADVHERRGRAPGGGTVAAMGGLSVRVLFGSLLLAGCGKVSDTKTVDAPAGPDADLGGDATVVTQTALFGGAIGAAADSVDIVSSLPNNTVLATAKTDASGNATIRVYPGGSVTAVYKHTVDMGADLITWSGVKPGDKLTFGSRAPSTTGQTNTALGSQTYSWPVLANATSYQILTSCGSLNMGPGTLTSLTLSESSLCHREPMDVLFRAFNGITLVGFSFRPNLAFTNGGTVSIANWNTNVSTGSINITGLPPEISSVFGEFITIIDSDKTVTLNSYNGAPTGGAFSATFPWHPFGEHTEGMLFLTRPGFSGMTLLDSFPPSTLAQTVAAPALPPWAQGNTTSSSALKMASWFLVPDASSTYNGQILHLNWNHVISGTLHRSQWDIILPPGQTSITFPALPAALSDHQPSPEDGLGAFTTVFDISSVTDYDMLRKQPSANIMCLDCAVRAGDFQRVVFTQL
jgi:hypothetical protein